MRTLIFITTLLISNLIFGQNPYDKLKGEFRNLFDPIPIDKGQEDEFFIYATALYKQDSLQKAGQIFDRLYWLDTSSYLARKSLFFRKEIEQKIIQQTQDNLNNVWSWTWSGSNWGPSTPPPKNSKAKRIKIDCTTIKFFCNDTLLRQTKYALTQNFDWVNGFLSNHLQYLDNCEEWYFHLASMDSFTSDRLVIVQKSNYVCCNCGEAYTLVTRKTTANMDFVQVADGIPLPHFGKPVSKNAIPKISYSRRKP